MNPVFTFHSLTFYTTGEPSANEHFPNFSFSSHISLLSSSILKCGATYGNSQKVRSGRSASERGGWFAHPYSQPSADAFRWVPRSNHALEDRCCLPRRTIMNTAFRRMIRALLLLLLAFCHMAYSGSLGFCRQAKDCLTCAKSNTYTFGFREHCR